MPLWTTLGQDAAATVGGAVVSVGTGGEVVVDGQTVARGVAAGTATETGGSDLSGRSSTGDGGGGGSGTGGGGTAEGTGGGGSGGSSGAVMVRGELRQGWWVLEGCVGASLLLLVVVL